MEKYDIKKITEDLSRSAGKALSDWEEDLLKRSIETLLGNIRNGRNCYWKNKKIIIPSSACYIGAWNWDSAFHALATAKWDLKLSLQQVRFFFDEQLENGMFPDAILADGLKMINITKPPVFAWVLMKIYEEHPEIDVAYFYRKLVKNEKFWTTYRMKDGLFHYDSFTKVESDYLKDCRNESGWDNSVRWDKGAQNMWAVDLNSYMILYYDALRLFANALGKQEDGSQWEYKGNELAKRINEVMWDTQEECYFDVHIKTGRPTRIYSPASFTPLFAGIATKEQASALSKHMNDPNKFYPLLPTVSYDDPNYESSHYWRGPCWLNVAYFALKGLQFYGYNEQTKDFKMRLLKMCDNEKRSIYEYYDSRTGKGVGASNFGWSAAFIIEMILKL